MPAKRSRTMHWRQCLEQVHERGGALDIAVAHPDHDEPVESDHLVWRVRILALSENEIVVERPTALGQAIPLDRGVALVAVMTVGQNRWMFRTENLGTGEEKARHRVVGTMRLAMPKSVRRCQRRMDRMATNVLKLPQVTLWPLLDPKSVVLAERAQELQFEQGERAQAATPDAPSGPGDLMPEVGPKFDGVLLNIGGGGVGLQVPPEHNQMLARHKLFWMRVALPPQLTTPICATAKLVHTHMQSDQHIYAGMAFDFSFNAAHQRLVVSQICRFVAEQQREQREAA